MWNIYLFSASNTVRDLCYCSKYRGQLKVTFYCSLSSFNIAVSCIFPILVQWYYFQPFENVLDEGHNSSPILGFCSLRHVTLEHRAAVALICKTLLGAWWCMCLFLALRRQRPADLSAFKASLVYLVKSVLKQNRKVLLSNNRSSVLMPNLHFRCHFNRRL